MKNPAWIWNTRGWSATRGLLALALSSAPARSLSASRAIARPALLIALLVVLAPVCVILTQSGLHASVNTITVNNLTDPASVSGNGFCTLREAIDNANAASDTSGGDCAPGTGTDTIKFGVSGTISLSSTLPSIANSSPGSLTIDGSGQTVTIDGGSSVQVLSVNSGAKLSLNFLTIAHGSTSGNGGGINNGGTLTVTNSTFSNNSAQGSFGTGGGINNGGTLTVTNSTFSNNSASLVGGGIGNEFGTGATITNSTFDGNSASAGGGVDNEENAGVTITNDTFYRNSASGGIAGGVGNAGTMSVTNSTFEGNAAPAIDGGGGIGNQGNFGTVTIANSIFANNVSGNCTGTMIGNNGFNISDDSTCGFGGNIGANGHTIGDGVSEPTHVGLDPGGLANNGGPTETIKLEPGSFAIDAVPLADQCPATDQRGNPRPEPSDNSGACDIGAVESTLEGLEKLVVNPSPPSKLDFGTVSVGTTSASQTATITSEFNDDTVDFFGTFVMGNFVKTGTTCGSSLAPLQSCQVSFACKPKTTGSLIGAYAFLYSSVESGIMDADDYLKIGVVQLACTGA